MPNVTHYNKDQYPDVFVACARDSKESAAREFAPGEGVTDLPNEVTCEGCKMYLILVRAK